MVVQRECIIARLTLLIITNSNMFRCVLSAILLRLNHCLGLVIDVSLVAEDSYPVAWEDVTKLVSLLVTLPK